MGLYNYPVLMAADILLFNSKRIPVGLDQTQHVEIARDIAIYFNNRYGNIFTLPESFVEKETSILVGLDGRKMSKSYGNTIQLFTDEKPCKNQLTELSPILDFQERQRTLITQYANYIVFLQHLMRFKTLSAECSKDLAGEMQKRIVCKNESNNFSNARKI